MKYSPIEEKLINKGLRFYSKHGKAKKYDDIVAAMYALYKTGLSYQAVAKTYRKNPKTVFDMFKRRGYELRSSMRHPVIRIDGIKFIKSPKDKYWRSSIEGGKPRIMLSHYIWLKNKGSVPKGHRIHFKDFNPDNYSIENLELFSIKKAAGTRVKFKNQYSSGKPIKNKKQKVKSEYEERWKRASEYNPY